MMNIWLTITKMNERKLHNSLESTEHNERANNDIASTTVYISYHDLKTIPHQTRYITGYLLFMITTLKASRSILILSFSILRSQTWTTSELKTYFPSSLLTLVSENVCFTSLLYLGSTREKINVLKFSSGHWTKFFHVTMWCLRWLFPQSWWTLPTCSMSSELLSRNYFVLSL